MMNEYDLGHVMLSLWYPTLAVRYYFFTENVSILESFVKEDADVDYISLDLHLIKCTLISVWNIVFVLVHLLNNVCFPMLSTDLASHFPLNGMNTHSQTQNKANVAMCWLKLILTKLTLRFPFWGW